ncbi:Crp/Fnr family transcriptional regulator [Aquisalimonas asiatica]|uniref:Cyclic nucleotide-binding protein n=1 Tax=Aquisalimonas asiatica TaxID=406100 RepID=A0A1H8PT82_9GAMM|nr:Crp/Fnr family transcriptional regulator [Aquisalimonas asiatica]SEO44928.1 cyclic nucleotide-binding protein [Aquisalimonas asiatica]
MTTADVSAQLRQQPFFADLNEATIQELSQRAATLTLSRGDVLFRQGEVSDVFYLVTSGEILIEIPAISGPALEIQRLTEGQILGWSWLIPPYKWTFQARAESDTELLTFDGAAILAHCEEDPAFGYAVLKKFSALMSERLEAARRRMMDEWNPPGFA